MKRYYLNFKSQYKTLSFTIWLAICLIVAFLYVFLYQNQRNQISEELHFLLIPICVFIFPSFFLYIHYLYYSIGKKIIINRSENRIYVNEKGRSLSFDMIEIDRILKVCSYPLSENRVQWMPTDPFFYIKIVRKDGQEIIITSLMTDSDFKIYGYEIEIQKRFVSII
jgi:hypothetical protein